MFTNKEAKSIMMFIEGNFFSDLDSIEEINGEIDFDYIRDLVHVYDKCKEILEQ